MIFGCSRWQPLGTKINLSRFIMKKMFKVLKEKDKEAKSKRKTSQQSQFAVPYVTLITHYAKTLGILNPRYELFPIAITYNLASIAKMGYKDNNNNRIFVKVRGVNGDDDGEEHALAAQGVQAQDLAAPSFVDIMRTLTSLSN